MSGNRFAPDDIVTREQAATFFLRYARLIGKVSADEITGIPDFADKDRISDWALEGAMWCSMNGIITGKPGDNGMLFDPQGYATRAELAAMLHRFSDNVISKPAEEQPVPPDTSPGSSSADLLKITFETNGGTPIPPVFVRRGGKLSDPPVPLKDNYAFTGWYTDSSLTQPFYSDAPIMRNMTLYASYAERDYDYREYVDPVKFLPDCPADISFDILSPETITDSNLGDYITIVNKVKDTEIPDVTVTSLGGNVYSISPRAPYTYTPGHIYELTLLNESLSFLDEKEEVRTIAFSIFKPETFIVEFRDGIVYLLWSQVNVIGDGVYTLTKALADEKGITAGTTICLTDELDSNGQGILTENSRIRKVLNVVNTDSADPPRVMLFTEAASVDDVYENIDIHWNGSADMDTVMASIDTEKIEQAVLASEGTRKFTKLLAAALNESQILAGMLSMQDVPGSGFTTFSSGSSRIPAPKELNPKYTITVGDLLPNLDVEAYICWAENKNFTKDTHDNKWLLLAVKFEYNVTLKQKVQIKAEFTFKECITLETGMNATKESATEIDFNAWVDIFSQTNLEFSVLVKTVDIDEFLDITDEIDKLIKGFTKDYSESDVPEVIREVLGEKGDYIDLVEIDLFTLTQIITPGTPVVQLTEKGTFVIKLNLAVGLKADAALLYARRIGFIGSTDITEDMTIYTYEHKGCYKREFNLYCAGYLGVKAGIRITVSLSLVGLEDLGSIGVQGELGAYMDLYGFLKLHLYEEHNMYPELSMNGGVYMEVGVYVELSVFFKSEFIKKVKAELELVDKKYPLCTLGNQYVFYRFKNAGTTVYINKNQYNINDSWILVAEMLDLKTGKLVDQIIPKGRAEVHSAHPFIEVDWQNSLIKIEPEKFGRTLYSVHVPEGTKRLDTILRVYYKGDHISFSKTQNGYAYSDINLIWIHPSIDINKIKLTATATYVIYKDGQFVAQVDKIFPTGYPPGGIDFDPWLDKQYGDYYCAEITSVEGNWDEPTWEDVTFKVYITTRRVLVSWMYAHEGQWRYEIYAMKITGMPPYPENYMSPGPALTFDYWERWDYLMNYSYKVSQAEEEGVEPAFYYTAIVRNLTYLDKYLEYDATEPVFTFTGTKEQCEEKFMENQKTMPVVFHTVAQYQYVFVPVYYHYPVKIYTAYEQNFDIRYPWKVVWYPYGTTPPPEIKSYPGCTILGWGTTGFGIKEYDINSLPAVTGESHFYLIVEFKLRRAIFKTDIGTFADGSTTFADSGMIPYPDYLKYMEDFYNANNINTIQPACKDGVRYKFSRWEADYSLDEDGNQIETWNAVWVVDLSKEYTVTFNAGEGAAFPDGETSVTLPCTYGTSLDLSSFAPVKEMDNHYIYTHSGWVDQDGNTYGTDDVVVIQKDMTFTAVYQQTDRIYTIIFDAGAGNFPDGAKTIEFTGKYGEDTTVSQSVYDPVPPASDAVYHYEFIGWFSGGEQLDTLPETFTQDMYITAEYERVFNEYTVTFDAGSGSFEGGEKTITQTYHYGDEIVPPAAPTKAENEYFRYEFTGWSPPLNPGDRVTGNCTYTATYKAVSKGTVLPESGITVTDGEVTEDICVGSISGYTYEMEESPVDGTLIPVLTITGDGLTFSGQSNEVYIQIAETANSVTFNNLRLSGSYDKLDAPLWVLGGETLLTINIEGDCAFIRTANTRQTLRIEERPVKFAGTGEEASLEVRAAGARSDAIFAYNCDITFDSLNLNINMEAAGIDEEDFTSAIRIDYDGLTQRVCSFVYSDVTISSVSAGFDGVGFAVEIINSTFTMNCDGPAGGGPGDFDAYIVGFTVDASNVEITAGQGLWINGEAVFTGDSQIKLTATVDDGAAFSATEGITVPEGYDLGGASIQLLTDSSTGDYYTFAIEQDGTWIPAKTVEINLP